MQPKASLQRQINLSTSSSRESYVCLGHCPLAYIFQDRDDLCDFDVGEYAGKAHVVQVRERALIEEARVHGATLRQVIDDHVEELDLIGGKVLGGQEGIKGSLGRSSLA